MEWIKCSEQMPDAERKEILLFYFGMIELGKYNEITNEFMLPFSVRAIPKNDVTHWMPLPQPPETE